MPDYNNGKIYKIINPQNEIIYIGSTAQEKLCDRFKTHTHKGNGNKIILIEEYPCSSKEQLCMKEQEVIEQYDNLLNKYRAFNLKEDHKETIKKYYEENKDKISKNHKVYCEENKDKIKEYRKKYREENKDKIKEYRKKYYEENPKVICDCGCEITKNSMIRHKKTKKHIDLMSSCE